MVICIVPGCSKRSDRDRDVSFFRIPDIRTRTKEEHELSKKRQVGYLTAIPRDLSCHDLSQIRICSRHFISGKPAYFNDTLNPDWVPTQNLTENSSRHQNALLQQERYMRSKARASKRNSTTPTTGADIADCPVNDLSPAVVVADECTTLSIDKTPDALTTSIDVCTQTDGISITELRAELNHAYETIRQLKDQVSQLSLFTESSFQSQSDKFIQHYTGLSNFKVVKAIYDFVSNGSKFGRTKLTPFQEYLLTLVKLRHNFSMQDLAHRFGIHSSTVSRIFLKWLVIMDIRLEATHYLAREGTAVENHAGKF